VIQSILPSPSDCTYT